MVGGQVTARGRHLKVLSGGRRWRDAVAARPSSGRSRRKVMTDGAHLSVGHGER
jgi:hypothetical protein